MDTTLIVVIIVVVVVLVALGVAAYLVGARRRSARLREHFGPEYERALAETDDPKAAERRLAEREKRHRGLDLRPLGEHERAEFQNRWLAVQSGFVDDPDRAVERADAFVTEVMRARGYPVADFDRRAEDVSVEHPVVVQRYREAREISGRNARGGVDTEELRRAVTSYRSLVEALLDESGDGRRGADRSTGGDDGRAGSRAAQARDRVGGVRADGPGTDGHGTDDRRAGAHRADDRADGARADHDRVDGARADAHRAGDRRTEETTR